MISAYIGAIEVQKPPRSQCDSAGTSVSIILLFDRPVSADRVAARVVSGPIFPD